MTRKIIHIDMDAFYASVTLKKHPHLMKQPVVIASHHQRAVVVAASYPARVYGVHSAMSIKKALQLCPHLVQLPPEFNVYREVSAQIHQIFKRYTAVVEPLSLDEAYLDVTTNLKELPSATAVAQSIQRDILQETGLTASAGVAPNKFLAKIASDWNKPHGLFVIKPHQINQFIQSLPLNKIPGVGKVTHAKLLKLNLNCLGDLQQVEPNLLEHHFGKYGKQLYLYAQGIDERPVNSKRIRQQISKEITFNEDLTLDQCEPYWLLLCEQVWTQLQEKNLNAYGVTIKLKEANFHVIQHSQQFSHAISNLSELMKVLKYFIQSLHLDPLLIFRLVGVGVYHFETQQSVPQLTLW